MEEKEEKRSKTLTTRQVKAEVRRMPKTGELTVQELIKFVRSKRMGNQNQNDTTRSS